ncbi:Predicted SAM-depedendent methyltransferase [Friedmanniella luteola]|uniref:Predicted SAM-depedendent methyltransferase n=1 Tax=Friedmanniella luteola TaxID=546871 RepID=A0A1H1NNN3_9ACTN|nr:methyltransferase domain-containing protein [Friedmanniella luteola]SDS00578.1 Predicted SAM-depedendent methyltransferase [Friedmanniella luteola]
MTRSLLRRVLGGSRRRVYDAVLLSRRRHRFQSELARARAAGPVRINVGAGRRALPGWVNTDISWRCAAHLDVVRPWPVPAGSVDLVHGDNVIEHLTLEQGRVLLREAFRALAPGGVIRLSTPDVEASARSYLENGELARLGMARNAELGNVLTHPVQLLSEVYVGAEHYRGFCYDYAALAAEMRAVGFEVERRVAGDSHHPDLKGLEHRMHPAEVATQLCVEGTRPG